MLTFSDIHSKFAKKVEKRKDRLVREMQNSPHARDTFFYITDNDDHLDDFLYEVRKLTTEESPSVNLVTSYRLDEVDIDDRRISFRSYKQNNRYFVDHLALRYYDLYLVGKHAVERYVFFEIYFDEFIMSVLMKKSTFNTKNRAFPEFDMDAQEFLQLKAQLLLWNQWFRPEVETIDDLTEAQTSLVEFICDPIHEPFNAEFRDHLPDLISQDGSPWWLVAHIIQMQMQILSSKHFAPHYFLNIICDNPPDISRSLQRYISALLFTDDPPLPDEIQLLPSYETGEQPDRRQFGKEQILILSHQKKGQHSKIHEIMDEFILQHQEHPKTLFPFRRTPILLGKDYIHRSTVSNFAINAISFNSVAILQPDNLENLREMICHNLHAILDGFALEKVPFSVAISDKGPLDKPKRLFSKHYARWYEHWQYWTNSNGFLFVPESHLELAAWISLGLRGAYHAGVSNDPIIVAIAEKLSNFERAQLERWNASKIFFSELKENISSFSREKPYWDDFDEPFINDIKDNECIIFSEDLLAAYTEKRFGKGSQELILNAAKKQGILWPNNGEKWDRVVSFYDDPDSPKKSRRVYVFLVNELSDF